MRNSYVLYLSLLVLPATLWAQVEKVDPFVSSITDVLGQKKFQTTKEEARALSKLEDLNDLNSCSVEIENQESCQGFAQSLLPKGYKETGWKTLLEIKYQPIQKKSARSTARANYNPQDLSSYKSVTGSENKEITTAAELDAMSKEAQAWYSDNGMEIDLFDVRTQLILDQITNDKFYNDLSNVETKNDRMFDRIKEYSKSMSDQEYLRFVSAMAGYVDYNHERSTFQQTEDAGLGFPTSFEQITGSKAGVCGDIHSMAAKMGEARGWEAFTVGYALQGDQHVVTAMTNPKEPGKLMIVNYGGYEEQSLNDGNWVNPTPTEKMQEVGMQLRIFKNDKAGDANGKMQQIATIPTALGGFMNDLFKKENQIAKAMPNNENFRVEKVGAEVSRHKVEVKKSGNKITDKIAGEGIVIYEGETDGAQIYGVAVSHDVYKDIYRWDPKQNKCVLKKNKYFSVGVAGSLVDLKHEESPDTFYAYLNMKGGQIFHVYQSEHFQFKGLLGYELEGFAAFGPEGKFSTGDINITTLMGVIADYNKGNTQIHTALTYETNVGLRNQNLMTDFSKIPSNINPINFNAVSLDAKLTQKLNDKTAFVTDNNFTLTRVGGRVLLSTGIIHNKTSLMASYQGGFKPLNIGNTLQGVNLLQNYNNMDGVRLTVGQSFGSKDRAISGSFSAYGGISTSTVQPLPIAGASLKLNLNGKKKKKSTGN